MKKEWLNSRGFSLVEVILAGALFILLTTIFVGSFLYGQEATFLAGNRAQAVLLAEEGLEAARNIRDANFSNLSAGTHGLAISSNVWTFSGSSDTTGIFTREVVITTVDSDRFDVASTVTWQQNQQRNGSVTLTTRLTNWRATQGGGPPTPASCNAYAVEQGYTSGTCRANTNQCGKNDEDHLSDGDVYCTGGGGADTCCALP